MIQQRNQRMRQQQKIQRRKLFKKIFTNVNVGAMLLSTSVLTQVQSENAIVHAQKSQKKFSPQEFINQIGQSAKEIAAKNDLYASVMIAQAALESGWGSSTLAQAPNYNLFGIKASKNDNRVEMDTLEDDGTGSYYQIKDSFRKYDSYADSLLDYARVLTGEGSAWRKNFYQGALKSNTTSYQDATKHLTGRYATDTRYGGKLDQLISTYQLDQFDGPKNTLAPSTSQSSGVTDKKVESSTNQSRTVSYGVSSKGSYTVQPGDGLYKIANENGVKLDDLLKANGLSINSMIHPNQVLKIPGQAQSSINLTKPIVNAPVENTPVSVQKLSTSKGNYTIKAGDSLYAIASKHGISIQDLLIANGIQLNTVIHPNQQLRIPTGNVEVSSHPVVDKETPSVSKGSQANTQTAQDPTYSQTTGNYTIKVGDSLWAIANRHGMTLASLLSANNLTANSLILPGQKLNVSSNGASNQSVTVSNTQQAPKVEVPQQEKSESVSAPVVTEKINETPQTTTNDAPVASGSYVVKANDTLYAIALRNGLNVYDLIEKNGGTNIYIGQVINF
ncbi:LysM peptidoglycan-binding domain-containing protein [Facklamia miroungae]|uniref:Peptidoglycan hydrolase n=1 Tax=Facklamia miroungae TaxID=120956 RepID=A0A1G7UQA2_9LACT|nr:LysM peptidoglycan-binding domain-containing protein [Facklamia miroungae]NKZ30164.1 LysM peptidoglycan-binding domain-containing protein [Facklamia miroungae]SDG49694.1 Flagellum-specific peptidoglycan hydrolase FlgJ [Facklamia miroungae]